MKKILTIFAAAVAALSLASCEKDDVIKKNNTSMDNDINVTAMMAAPATKATNVVTNTTTDALNSFYMAAFSGTDEVLDAKYSKGTDKKFTTAGKYYWNTVGNYKFFAFAEDNELVNAYSGCTGATALTSEGLSLGNATIPFKVATSGAQSDPVFACSSVASKPADGTVDLTFYHMLSRVNVTPTISIDADVKLKAKVVGWKFQGVGIEGTVAKATDASALAWNTTKTGDVTNEYDEKTISWNNVIPGKKVVETLVLTVDFFDEKDNLIGRRYLTTKDFGTAAVKEYAQGYQYTYKLTVKNDGGDDTDDDRPDGPDGPDEPISKFKITVDEVTVVAWQTTTGGEFTYEENKD